MIKFTFIEVFKALVLILKGLVLLGRSYALRIETALFGKTPKRSARRADLNKKLRFFSVQAKLTEAQMDMLKAYFDMNHRNK